MRLLDTATLKVVSFSDHNIPRYAILSHTWGEEEITLQDMEGGSAASKKGFAKVDLCCAVAAMNGFPYVWIDTCCIDKTSSAELSEAINSMYHWYEEADECYAYLADVMDVSQIKDSKWFTRGWTLQELIAPSRVIFYSGNWQDLGTKKTLEKVLSDCTGIPNEILAGDPLETCSVAQRMSWAAKRDTSRIEDGAYCLMGIFGINMSLIYGEREAAFIRLQEEIMKVSDDQSLLAWKCEDDSGGILAPSARAFVSSGNIVRHDHFDGIRSPWTVSSRGVHVDLPLLAMDRLGWVKAILNCADTSQGNEPVTLYLRDIFLTVDLFRREKSHVLDVLNTGRRKHRRPPQYPIRRICIHVSRLRKRAPAKETTSESFRFRSPNALDMSSDLSDLLHTAARTGDADSAWLLMLNPGNIDVNAPDEQNRTALWHAVKGNHDRITTMLLAWNNIEVNLKDVYGRTPLFQAVIQGSFDIVQKLLRSGRVNIALQDEEGMTVLFHAVKNGHRPIVRLLLDHGANPMTESTKTSAPCYQAACDGNEAIVDLFLRWGVSIDNSAYLYDAALSGHETCTRLLIKKGAGLEMTWENNKTAIVYAARRGHEGVFRLLLESGASFECRDKSGRTPLIHATEHDWALKPEHETIVQLLLEKGADIEAACKYGRTTLIWATLRDHKPLVRILLDHGANVDAQDNYGRTALMYAASRGFEDVAQMLLEKGTNLDLTDEIGHTTFTLTTARQQTNILGLLENFTQQQIAALHISTP